MKRFTFLLIPLLLLAACSSLARLNRVPTPTVAVALEDSTAEPSATVPPSPAPPVPGVTTDTLNVRAGPGTNFPVLSTLKQGQAITIVAKSADGHWWQISQGWVSSDYVQAGPEAAALPVANPNQTPVPSATPVPAAGSWTIGQRTRDYGCAYQGALPDAACTPGAIVPNATKDQVCAPGYAQSLGSLPQAVMDEAFSEYGVSQPQPRQYQLDQLIPLELGGTNDIANVWPEPAEPRPGYHEKDQVEIFLVQQVCSGAMSLQEAQAQIASNWVTLYTPSLPTLTPEVTNTPLPSPTVKKK